MEQVALCPLPPFRGIGIHDRKNPKGSIGIRPRFVSSPGSAGACERIARAEKPPFSESQRMFHFHIVMLLLRVLLNLTELHPL